MPLNYAPVSEVEPEDQETTQRRWRWKWIGLSKDTAHWFELQAEECAIVIKRETDAPTKGDWVAYGYHRNAKHEVTDPFPNMPRWYFSREIAQYEIEVMLDRYTYTPKAR